MALTFEQLQTEIACYTYWPGWQLHVDLDPIEGPCLWIITEPADGYHPGQTTMLRIRSLIPPMADPDAFRTWLLWRLLQVASHECREGLRYNGQLVADPHVIHEFDG